VTTHPAHETGRRRLLMVDDDRTFCAVIARHLEERGFDVRLAHDGATALELARVIAPHYAVVDLNLPDTSGLRLLRDLRAINADTKLLMLTGYSSIVSAIDAVKLGAVFYLCKPTHADEIIKAFEHRVGDSISKAAPLLPSVARVEWEHIQRVLADHQGLIASTARALNMHRRTLQRKLKKNPPRA
jgi:two-component system, response regulator RegA